MFRSLGGIILGFFTIVILVLVTTPVAVRLLLKDPSQRPTAPYLAVNLLFGLLTHPDQLDTVRADRSLVPQAIEEALRWETPLLIITRMAAEDLELGGVSIPKGAVIAVSLGAANRDPGRYRDPDAFDIFRDPEQHISFGDGPHRCLGMHLARVRVLCQQAAGQSPAMVTCAGCSTVNR